MDANPSNDNILLSANIEKIRLVPGTTKVVPFSLTNRQAIDDLFELSIEGVPVEWVAMDQRVVRLAAEETRQFEIKLSVPASAELRPGRFPFQIQATSQTHPEVSASVPGELTVAAYQSQGRIGLFLAFINYAVSPGGRVSIPLLLQNRGLAADTFTLEVRGLPQGWATIPETPIHLNPGEQKEATVTIQPPRAAGTSLGAVPFDILVHSQVGPGQPEMVRCTLNVAAFSIFSAWLQPRQLNWGDTGLVSVKNNGNTADVYSIEWASQDASLVYEKVLREPATAAAGESEPAITYAVIAAPEILRVQPGRTNSVEFRARPRRLPIFGGEFNLPFSISVTSSNTRQTVSESGNLLGRALIPVWVPVSLAILLAMVLCLSLFSYVSSNNRASREAETQQAETALALLGSQTPGFTPTATTTLTPTLPSATAAIPVTGLTATPTFTGPPPTPTFTVPPPTATFTAPPPTATNTVPPPTQTATVTPTQPTSTPQAPQLPGMMVFQSNRDGNLELYSLNATNFKITRLTANQASDSQPALAPDGTRIAYVSNQTGNNEIFLTGTDLRTPVNLTNNPADDQSPTWSPDGQWIAFTSNRDGNAEIYVMAADGSQVHNVTNNPADDFGPSWFQTGGLLDRQDWIVFTSNRDGNQEIYIIKPDGTGARNLTNNPANDYSPAGSSNVIAFVSERDGNQEIYLMSVDGTAQTNLTNNPGRDYDPSISPDGAWVAFTSERDGNPELYVIRTDGSGAFNLTQNPAQDSHPSWR